MNPATEQPPTIRAFALRSLRLAPLALIALFASGCALETFFVIGNGNDPASPGSGESHRLTFANEIDGNRWGYIAVIHAEGSPPRSPVFAVTRPDGTAVPVRLEYVAHPGPGHSAPHGEVQLRFAQPPPGRYTVKFYRAFGPEPFASDVIGDFRFEGQGEQVLSLVVNR